MRVGKRMHSVWNRIIPRDLLILVMIIVVASIIFLTNANWGLPTRLHPDEYVIVNDALRLAQENSFEPKALNRPNHLMIKISAVAYKLTALAAGKTVIEWANGNQNHVLVSRVLAGTFSVGSVFLAWLIGKRYNKYTGLLAAALFTLFPAYIIHAHYSTPEMPNVFCIMLFIYFTIRYHEVANYKDLFFMTLATVLFTIEKYPGILLCVCVAISVIFCAIRDKSYIRVFQHGLASCFMFFGLVFLLDPVLLLNINGVITAAMTENRAGHLGADNLSFIGNLLFYISTFVSISGVLFAVVFVFGCYTLIKKRILYHWLPLFSGVMLWIPLSALNLHWDRWGMPMYVSPLLIASIGLTESFAAISIKPIKTKKSRRLLCFGYSVLCIMIMLNFIFGASTSVMSFAVQDSRISTQLFCNNQGITTHNSVFEGYTPLYPAGPATVFHYFESVDSRHLLKSSVTEYVILSSSMFNRYYAEPERYAVNVALYDSLASEYDLIFHLKPAQVVYHPLELVSIIQHIRSLSDLLRNGSGPELMIYKANEMNYVTYPLGTSLIFSKDGYTADQYARKGLSGAENAGSWSLNNQTEFRFYIDEKEANGLRLNFTVNPFVSNAIPVQYVNVYANDDLVGHFEISAYGDYYAVIPPLHQRLLDIRFEYFNMTVPSGAGISEEKREIALFFSDLSITTGEY